MHLGSLESTQEARVALGDSYTSFVLSKLPACIRYTHAKHEQILNFKYGNLISFLNYNTVSYCMECLFLYYFFLNNLFIKHHLT